MSCLTLFSQYIPSYLNETWYSIIRKGSQTVVLLCVLNNAFEKSINSNNAFLFIYGDLRNSNKISKLFIASFCGLQFFRIHLCKKFYSRNMSCLIHFNLSGSEYSFLHSSFRVVIIPIVRPFNNWLLKFFPLSDQFRSIHFLGGAFHFTIDGTFQTDTGSTFHFDLPNTFECDMCGTFKVLQSSHNKIIRCSSGTYLQLRIECRFLKYNFTYHSEYVYSNERYLQV